MDGLNFSVQESDNRKLYYEIWQRYKSGVKLDGEENVIAELMALHKDFYQYWNSADFNKKILSARRK